MTFPYHFAIVVGINFYPGFSDLRSPVEDATSFQEWLETDGGVPSENIIPIFGNTATKDIFSAEPTRDKINNAFRKLHKMIASELDKDITIWEKSRLYVFFSGHGIAPTGSEVALLMADAGNDAWPHIPCRRYLDYYMRSQYFKEVVVFADCCRSAKDVEPLGPAFEPRYPNMGTMSSLLGYATSDNTAAFEPPAPGNGTKTHSYFTEALLEALRGSHTPQAGVCVTDQTVADYVCKVVPERSGKQFPRVIPDTDNRIIFRAATSPPETLFNVTIHPPAGFTEKMELWFGTEIKVAEWDAKAGPWSIQLSAGLYEVRPQGAVDGTLFENDGLFKVVKKGQHAQL